MRQPVKLALIGGEVTLLAAFTGVGIHLAIQPHRVAFRPPPLVLPSLPAPPLPMPPTAVLPAAPEALPMPTATPFAPALFAKFGEQDRNLLLHQWEILRSLTSAIERYVETQVSKQIGKKP
jgi:hypothetical protein